MRHVDVQGRHHPRLTSLLPSTFRPLSSPLCPLWAYHFCLGNCAKSKAAGRWSSGVGLGKCERWELTDGGRVPWAGAGEGLSRKVPARGGGGRRTSRSARSDGPQPPPSLHRLIVVRVRVHIIPSQSLLAMPPGHLQDAVGGTLRGRPTRAHRRSSFPLLVVRSISSAHAPSSPCEASEARVFVSRL